MADLALDLRWTTSQLTRGIWQQLDPEAWERTENPYLILLNAAQGRLEEAARDEQLLRDVARWQEKLADYRADTGWFGRTHAQSTLRCIAYFSMEFGLSEALPIYSGGLGMLAGDHVKTASDLGIPLVGVGLLYQQGYFRQVIAEDGTQREAFPYNDPSSLPITPLDGADGQWHRVRLELPGRTLFLRVWKAQVGRVPVYLLDSNDPLNIAWDRGITADLYAAGRDKRLLQELVLGVGGWRLLDELGLHVDVCHMNEGHAAFAVLARANSFAERTGVSVPVALRATRAGNVFTTHTPTAAAFDEFDPELVVHYAQPFLAKVGLPAERLLALGRMDPHDPSEPFNMAFLAMRGSCYTNAVSRLHGRESRRLFARLFAGWPEAEIPIQSITNGVHIPTWNGRPARRVWVEAYGSDAWLSGLAATAREIGDVDPLVLWEFRAESRRTLIEYVRRRLTRQLQVRGTMTDALREAAHALDPNALTMGFARRFTEYKRPNLLLCDPDRLSRLLLDAVRPVQLIVAGKAHPNDAHGKTLVREFARFAMRPELRSRVVFLEDYDMTLAQHLAAGIDVWLNTPRRPVEACGTSGMKMLFNGGLNVSIRDGWWDEAWTPDVGWQFGDGGEDDPTVRDPREAARLYEVLERDVVPEFYDRDADGVPRRWLQRVRASMSQLTPRFSSDRMLKEYVERAYLPAAEAFHRRVADDGRVAQDLYEWQTQLEEHWRGLHFGEVRATEADGHREFVAQVYLGELSPDSVRVELYADSLPGGAPIVIPMQRKHAIPGAVNGFVFTAQACADRPADHYTPRIVPWHPEVRVPSEEWRIFWRK
jgi:glycogen phosphorylase